ncbi:MAG: lamin tail domain-containing protein [Phycisphaerales bacterium]
MCKSARVAVLFLACIFGMGCVAHAAAGPVLINELMAANSSSLADPQGQFDDWVELYNAGDAAIDTAGMYLTDDLDVPAKWKIPTGVSNSTKIPAKGLLIVWLDGDTTDSGLHASFGLDAGGDRLALFDKDGSTLLDQVTFKTQRCDVSYGRYPSGADDWRFMMLATPGNLNSAAFEGLVADTKFSRDRGFCDGPFDVTITSKTPGAVIYYTLDGSEPGSATGRLPKGNIYTGPIHIAKTTCLRARALKDGWLPSNVDTQTYIFLADAMTTRQADVVAKGYPDKWFGSYPADYEMDPEVYNDPAYNNLMDDAMLAIPTLSLVTNKDNFFSQTNNAETGGIYIYTGHSSTGGQDWERPVSVELFTADGSREFHIDCGIRTQGGESRSPQKMPKHSFGLRFRSEYGPGQFEFPLFDGSPVDSFESLQLRGFFNNAWNHWEAAQRQRTQYIRDQWMHDSMLDMGQADGGRGFYVHLYINGIYWGLYDLQERPVSAHYAAYYGGDPDRIDAINGGRATSGTAQAWQELRGVVQSKDWTRILELMDIDEFIDWTLLNLFAGNVDLKTDGNWRAAGGGPDKRPWRFYVWDGEHVCESVNQNGNSPAADPTGLFTTLSSIPEFRIRFGDHVHKHLFNGGALTAERNAERWLKRSDEIETAVIAESARWGDYRRDVHQYQSGPYDLYTRDKYWIPEKNRLLNDYFPRRTSIALSQFRSRGLYPSIDAPVFNVNDQYQHGGHSEVGASLSMQNAAGTIWYTLDGSDPRVPGAVSEPTNQGKLVPENAAKRVLIPTGPVSEAWKGGDAFDDSTWISGAGGVGFERSTGYESLIGVDVQTQMYSRNASCYVRIPFTTTVDSLVNLSALALNVRYDDGFVVYLNGVEIARKNFTGNPVWNSAAYTQNPDSEAAVFEPFDVSSHLGRLKLGQNILAVQAMNQSTTSSDFLFSAELVSGAAATGNTPSGVSPTAVKYAGPIALSRSVQVKARALSGSTWSALNEAVFGVGPVAESLRISEIMYHPASEISDLKSQISDAEYVELTNIGSEPIDLAMVRFTKGIGYSFPKYELRAGGYCLVAKDISAFMARYGSTLPLVGQYTGSLDNAGEKIELVDAAGTVVESFEYKDDWFDLTDGLGFSLTVRSPQAAVDLSNRDAWRPSATAGGSPGKDDGGQVPEPGSVVINELMSNPSAKASDWIELFNTTDRAIDVSGWFLSDDDADLTKYRIADGTSIPAGGYLVFTQDQHFGNAADAGCSTPFGLSKDGETVYLHSGLAGVVTGYSEKEKFDASDAGVSLGRWQKSTGSYNFVSLSEPTPGKANAEPIVGPVVISEVMYHPADAGDTEYVELVNISDAPVALYDVDKASPWCFADDPEDPGIELLFPSDPPVTLTPGEYLVLAADADQLRAEYAIPAGVRVLSWRTGKLADDTQRLQLSKPGGQDDNGTRSWIRVDRVVYSDGSRPQDFAGGVDPWPVQADGKGKSLGRVDRQAYGNDPGNWIAMYPSPGAANH